MGDLQTGLREIVLSVNQDATEGILMSPSDNAAAVEFRLPGETQLGQLRSGLRASLTRIRNLAPPGRLDFRTASNVFRELRELGIRLATTLFQQPSEVDTVARFFEAAAPDWRSGDGSGVLFTYRAPITAMFPVEILPTFEFRHAHDVTDFASLVEAASAFAGFGSVVSRELIRHATPRLNASTGPSLRIRMFQDASLAGARSEREFFSTEPNVDLEGPWPDHLSAETDIADIVANSTANPLCALDGTTRTEPPHFVHFACHCDTLAAIPDNHLIRLQGQSGGARRLEMGRLEPRMTSSYLNMTSRERQVPTPVVVLNACGSSSLDPHTAASFPSLFIRQHLAGFIGTEVDVPDELAATFSRVMYRAILAGKSLGWAVHEARWKLLSREHSPLGLLWSSYASPYYLPIAQGVPDARLSTSSRSTAT